MFATISSGLQRKCAVFVAALLLSLAPFLLSCASGIKETKAVTVIPQAPCCAHPEIRKVAVMTFMEKSAGAMSGSAHACPVTGLNFIPGTVEKGAGEIVSGQIAIRLREMGFMVVGPERLEKTMDSLPKDDMADYSSRLALIWGRQTGADLVFMGYVMRFEERIGTSIAADKPASVAFSVAVISVLENRIIWSAKFEKTQKSLFANILDFGTFLKGGMVWQRAAKLSEIGVFNTLEQLPFKPTPIPDGS